MDPLNARYYWAVQPCLATSGSVGTVDAFKKHYLVSRMAKNRPPKRPPARSQPETLPQTTEPVITVLDRLARNPAWNGEITAEQSRMLETSASSDEDRAFIALFSKGSEEASVALNRVRDVIRRGEMTTPAIRKRIGPRLVHHRHWDALLDIATELGVKKMSADLAAVPPEVKSAFSAKHLTLKELTTDNAARSRRLKRDLAPIAAWALERDAELVATALLTFSINESSGSRFSLAKEALIALTLHLPEESTIVAINSSDASSRALSNLTKKITSTKQRTRSLQSFLVSVAKSRRTEVLASADCWASLSLSEIGQLLKTAEIVNHLSAQPAWWTARQRRELADEGIGALLRTIDCNKNGIAVIDKELLGDYLKDSKRAGNSFIREAFSAVVDSELEAQAVVHQVEIDRRKQAERDLESRIERTKAEHEATIKQLARVENELRRQERDEIQSRKEKDLAAKQPLLESITAIVLAAERMRLNMQSNDQLGAYLNEMEAILVRLSIRVTRDMTGGLIELTQGETVLYRQK